MLRTIFLVALAFQLSGLCTALPSDACCRDACCAEGDDGGSHDRGDFASPCPVCICSADRVPDLPVILVARVPAPVGGKWSPGDAEQPAAAIPAEIPHVPRPIC